MRRISSSWDFWGVLTDFSFEIFRVNVVLAEYFLADQKVEEFFLDFGADEDLIGDVGDDLIIGKVTNKPILMCEWVECGERNYVFGFIGALKTHGLLT